MADAPTCQRLWGGWTRQRSGASPPGDRLIRLRRPGRTMIWNGREVGGGRVPRQPGQVRKEAAATSFARVVEPASHPQPFAEGAAAAA